ncbi:MAG: hypothetical protein RLZZ399_792, partial [Verrucomicrobiota bacterium]
MKRSPHASPCALLSALAALCLPAPAPAALPDETFQKQVRPLLEEFCFDCHGEGSKKGGFSLDSFPSLQAHLADTKHWFAIWKNLESQMMPPAEKPQLSPEKRTELLRWIEHSVFRLDPQNPDPGRVTVRRLNRKEYQNTILDLLGIPFDADDSFPADDTGHGFDTLGDVLTISPILMEKYLDAAQEIARRVVFESGPRVPVQNLPGETFQSATSPNRTGKLIPLSEEVAVQKHWEVKTPGRYEVSLAIQTVGSPEATEHSARVAFKHGGQTVAASTVGWDLRKQVTLAGIVDMPAGPAAFSVEVSPQNPPAEGQKPLSLRVLHLSVRGPLEGTEKEYAPEFYRVFPEGPFQGPPENKAAYRRRILEKVVTRAFRRPADEATLKRLEGLSEAAEREHAGLFEAGIAQALTAILASPRFLLRAEIQPEPNNPGKVVAVDEFSLASRLSYFLWSSLPDEELLSQAKEGKLRANLRAQVDRLLAHPRSERFVDNFVGQWLQTRDVETVNLDAKSILGEEVGKHFGSTRSAMREETELLFTHILQNNRPAVELLTADYTFLNEKLAQFYGIPGVKGGQMQKVPLPADSPRRGGILTHGSILLVTSNPTRTSPVKRGLFILENLLGSPPPPAPPNVPELEKAKKAATNPTMREVMEIHRKDPLCSSCHARMDPLGLALEGFNAAGGFRARDHGRPIETAGQLITGEKFNSPEELAHVLATSRREDFYRCLAEKLLIYALGRGLEYYDTVTLHQI